jgi:dihydrofolate reductase
VGQVLLEKSVSLDGYITGPNPGPDNPLGEHGDLVFAWMMGNRSEKNFIRNNELLAEGFESTGAVIIGKRMFEIIDGPDGWVAPDGTPFEWPVFVLTHEVREPVTKGKTTFTFVTRVPSSKRGRRPETSMSVWQARTSPSSSSRPVCSTAC